MHRRACRPRACTHPDIHINERLFNINNHTKHEPLGGSVAGAPKGGEGAKTPDQPGQIPRGLGSSGAPRKRGISHAPWVGSLECPVVTTAQSMRCHAFTAVSCLHGGGFDIFQQIVRLIGRDVCIRRLRHDVSVISSCKCGVVRVRVNLRT